jgi:uncharacterized protein YtpQ (UPF0354 family)
MVAVVDFPRSVRFVNGTDLEKLALDEERLFELARRNLAEYLGSVRERVQPIPEKGIGYLGPDPYESSRIILHEDWAELARTFNDRLLVAVPGAGLVLYADGSKATALDALRVLAR